MSLSERLRPDVEAAPWVIEEVKKLEAKLRHTGLTEMGFILEGANAGELAAYDQGCYEAQEWLDRMLHRPIEDCEAGGHSSERITRQRKELMELRKRAERKPDLTIQRGPFKGAPQYWFTREDVKALFK